MKKKITNDYKEATEGITKWIVPCRDDQNDPKWFRNYLRS